MSISAVVRADSLGSETHGGFLDCFAVGSYETAKVALKSTVYAGKVLEQFSLFANVIGFDSFTSMLSVKNAKSLFFLMVVQRAVTLGMGNHRNKAFSQDC